MIVYGIIIVVIIIVVVIVMMIKKKKSSSTDNGDDPVPEDTGIPSISINKSDTSPIIVDKYPTNVDVYLSNKGYSENKVIEFHSILEELNNFPKYGLYNHLRSYLNKINISEDILLIVMRKYSHIYKMMMSTESGSSIFRLMNDNVLKSLNDYDDKKLKEFSNIILSEFTAFRDVYREMVHNLIVDKDDPLYAVKIIVDNNKLLKSLYDSPSIIQVMLNDLRLIIDGINNNKSKEELELLIKNLHDTYHKEFLDNVDKT